MLNIVCLVVEFLLFVIIHCERCMTQIKKPVCQFPKDTQFYPGYGFCSATQVTQQTVDVSRISCCKGYHEMENECIPVCKSGCENGRCTAPNACSCNDGYHSANGRCTPKCRNCFEGACVAPNQCVQVSSPLVNNGTISNSVSCKDGCVNGICNELNQCVCHDGYYFNEKLLDFGIKRNTVCTPKCDQPCFNGFCTGRNRCKCNAGYKLAYGQDPFTCVPVCDPEWVNCTYGKCLAPDKCQCNTGYKLVKTNCIPDCKPACVNGKCIAPGECKCFQGFQKTNHSNICKPSCNSACINGTCMGKHQCSCLNGYQNSNNSHCEPMCDPKYIQLKHGYCASPNILRCHEGYTIVQNDDAVLICSSLEISCPFMSRTAIIFIIVGAALVAIIICVIFIGSRLKKEYPAPGKYFAKDFYNYWLNPCYQANHGYSEPCDAQSTINTYQKATNIDDQIYEIIT